MDIKIDLSKSTLADWALVTGAAKGIAPDDFPQWIEFLDRVLVGGAKAYPMTALREVIAAVSEKIAEQSNPKATA